MARCPLYLSLQVLSVWLNVSDEDAKSYIRIFTFLDRETIEALVAEHEAAPHERMLQKTLARELTCMIHSREEYDKAVEASAILFGGATAEALHRLDEQTLLQVSTAFRSTG